VGEGKKEGKEEGIGKRLKLNKNSLSLKTRRVKGGREGGGGRMEEGGERMEEGGETEDAL
jgi:hypothetical protein